MSTPSTIAEAELSILMQLGRPDRRRSHRPHYGIRELPRGVAFKGARIRLLLASEIERVGVNDYRITDKGMARLATACAARPATDSAPDAAA